MRIITLTYIFRFSFNYETWCVTASIYCTSDLQTNRARSLYHSHAKRPTLPYLYTFYCYLCASYLILVDPVCVARAFSPQFRSTIEINKLFGTCSNFNALFLAAACITCVHKFWHTVRFCSSHEYADNVASCSLSLVVLTEIALFWRGWSVNQTLFGSCKNRCLLWSQQWPLLQIHELLLLLSFAVDAHNKLMLSCLNRINLCHSVYLPSKAYTQNKLLHRIAGRLLSEKSYLYHL